MASLATADSATLGRLALSMFNPVHIGLDEFGQQVHIKVIYKNLLAAGEPGGGKSALMNILTAHAALSARTRLVLFDGKQVELGLWDAVADEFVGPDLHHAIVTLKRLQRVMNNRYAWLHARQRRRIEPGDNLTKICTKVYGTSTKALRDAIVAANPSLHDNPNRIIVGHSYVIPPQNGGATPTNTQTAELPTQQQTATQSQQPTTTTPEHVYVVQSGDTLWSIARNELGNTAAVAAIRDLNQDVLKGSDRLRANMKLRLPAKPVAQAN